MSQDAMEGLTHNSERELVVYMKEEQLKERRVEGCAQDFPHLTGNQKMGG